MTLKIFIFLALVAGFAKANDNRYVDQMIESEENEDKKDEDAYESFRSTVYSPAGLPKSGGLPPSPKAGYNVPPPPVPAAYPAYLNGVGFGNLNLYGTSAYGGRYGLLPYSSSYYNYGSPYSALPYGYGPGVPAGLGLGNGLGYGAGYAYGNPYLGRTAYSPYSNAYQGFGGLGYRYGGVGYSSPVIRTSGVPAAGAYAGVPAQFPVPYTGVPAAVPASYASLPTPAVPAPAPVLPAPVSALPAYRPPLVATQAKDGSYRYAYAPPQRAAA